MKIFLTDDHELMRLGMKTWLEENTEHKVVGSAGSIGASFIEIENLPEDKKPELFIVDADLGEESGFDFVRKIRETDENVKILMYSMHKEKGFYLDAKASGANGYIVKDARMTDFKTALEELISGGSCFDNISEEVDEKLQDALKMLTPKERQVFQEILKESSNEMISRKMNVSLHTIEIYVSRIYDKLDIHFRSELVARYGS